jgi:hypothetical protein
MKCICDYWKIGMENIIDYIRVTHREGRGGYKGRSFKFCPWCGTELVEDRVPKKVVRMPVLESAKPEKKS